MQAYVKRFTTLSPSLYWGEWGYHGYGHALGVWETARRLAEKLIRRGIAVDLEIVQVAAIGHDAEMGPPLSALGASGSDGTLRIARYREEGSAFCVSEVLRRLEAPPHFIASVDEAILSTNARHDPASIEGAILAAADLRTAGLGSYEEFVSEGTLLHQELEILHARDIPLREFVDGSLRVLGSYACRKIHLTEEYFTADGASRWHRGLLEKCLRRFAEVRNCQGKVVVDLGRVSSPLAIRGWVSLHQPDVLSLVVRDSPAACRMALDQLDLYAQHAGLALPPTMGLPKEKGPLCLPDGSADEICLPAADLSRLEFSAADLRRVVREKGTLRLYNDYAPATPCRLSGLSGRLSEAGFSFQGEETDKSAGWQAVFTAA